MPGDQGQVLGWRPSCKNEKVFEVNENEKKDWHCELVVLPAMKVSCKVQQELRLLGRRRGRQRRQQEPFKEEEVRELP